MYPSGDLHIGHWYAFAVPTPTPFKADAQA